MIPSTPRRLAAIAAASGLALSLAACSGGASAQSSGADGHAHDHGTESGAAASGTGKTETAGRAPRLVSTYDGGVLVIDANTLEQVADLPIAGFNRVSPAGDGRHVAVSTAGGWAFVDAGTWAQGHGDHFHYYNAEPSISPVLVNADTPGHAVAHAGELALWDDGGTGTLQVVDIAGLADAVAAGDVPVERTFTPAAGGYHGVAVALEDGSLVTTLGTPDERNGGQILSADDQVLTSSQGCPGVHGEGTKDGAVYLGCEDGILALHGDHTHKFASPDAFGRIGNLFTSDESDTVLTDYKQDKEMGISLNRFGLLTMDGHHGELKSIDAGTDYTWRGLARGAKGEILVLGTDGTLQVRDQATGDVVRTIDVIDAWTAPEEWQRAHPQLLVVEGMAYVMDPKAQKVHAVDYETGEIWKSADLSKPVIETAVATAEEIPTAEAHDGHEGHDHSAEETHEGHAH